jgi:hypothetical protein
MNNYTKPQTVKLNIVKGIPHKSENNISMLVEDEVGQKYLIDQSGFSLGMLSLMNGKYKVAGSLIPTTEIPRLKIDYMEPLEYKYAG